MKLELVPLEGEKILTEEEKERLRRRSRPIPPEKLACYSEPEKEDLKQFLINLTILTEQYHHEVEMDHDDVDAPLRLEHIQEQRLALFKNPRPELRQFIDLLELCPVEAWAEFETMIDRLRGEEHDHYYATKLEAAADPFKVGIEDEIEDERMDLQMKCRLTPTEILDLFATHTLEELVAHLIEARQIMTGQFWNEDHYNT